MLPAPKLPPTRPLGVTWLRGAEKAPKRGGRSAPRACSIPGARLSAAELAAL